MSPSRREAPSGSGLARAAALAGSAVLIVFAVFLAGLVVLGMATGTHRQLDKGESPLWVVIAVQVLGVLSLITLGGVVQGCISVWQKHRRRILEWTLLLIPIWLVWAFLRIVEYSS